jgi:hypothetical protein
MPECRLCLRERDLRKSHIVPEFLYAPLYNEKGHMMGVNGLGRKGWRPLQNGIKQPLFCEECEQHFNEYFEKPFKRLWLDTPALPSPWPQREPMWVKVDYTSFKLFHLSVLFRASVSTLPTFAEVSLGPHEGQIRKQLLALDPGPPTRYPIMGLALIDKTSRQLNHAVTMPVRARFEGLCCYAIAYGGVQWWIAISAHINDHWRNSSVTVDGHLPLVSLPWTELGLVRQAGGLLSRTGT